jgi:hypothetical protein
MQGIDEHTLTRIFADKMAYIRPKLKKEHLPISKLPIKRGFDGEIKHEVETLTLVYL